MPFNDPVSGMNGRNSRSSNVSAMTGASRSIRSGHPPPQPNDTLSNAGVLSMLKTSTDTGDIGALSFNHSRLPTMPRQAHARRAHSSRPSNASHPNHHYAPSQTSRLSDSTTQRRGSLGSMQSMPPSLPPVGVDKLPLQVPAPTLDGRSYSLTAAQGRPPLPRHRSATSLKSAGHEAVRGHYLHPVQVPPPMSENRAPYIYPTRLKRPGYRSPSPALSDASGQVPYSAPIQPQRRQAYPGLHMSRPQPHSYSSDYAADYGLDGRPINPRLPPRAVQGGPPTAYDHAYRSPPVQPMLMHQPAPRMPPSYVHGAPVYQRHVPPRPPQMAPNYGSRAAPYPQYPPMQYPGYPPQPSRGPPPAAMANQGNSMFHNAARMVRQLPVRTDTPMTDLEQPSSDPPSSGTAPSSSNPPTPKDSTTIHLAVDPLFIDPTLTDLPDSSSEPVLPGAKYFEYADGLKMEEPDFVVAHPSVPPTGLVQRVRAMLESRNGLEAHLAGESDHERTTARHVVVREQYPLQHQPIYEEVHELATHRSPRVTVIEEFKAPAELPASPVQIAELSNSPLVIKHRITRELVQAELGPSSTANSSQVEAGDTETEYQVTIEPSEEPSTGSSVEKHDASTPDRGTNHENETSHCKQRSKSVAESAGSVSEPVTISGMNYALRFSAPIDTTVTSYETQSHDHFALDADTMTVQHQRSQEPSALETKNGATGEAHIVVEVAEPISPLQPGEVVNRSSAVSPLCTQILSPDASLGVKTDDRNDEVSEIVNSDQENSSPAANLPLATPRTPRTYSKSVSLPQKEHTAASTPSSHRFSLPPDMSTVGETTMNTTSDLVTDVAVRFSLPTTTITIGKPQIITIPPSSSPEKPAASPPRTQHGLEPRAMKRNSVTFADQVAPLNIKKVEPRRGSPPAKENAVVKSKSIIRRPSPVAEDKTESSYGSRESTTELRFPPTALNSRFGSTHLTRLKEESVEDMSISDHNTKRSSELQPDFKFPLPARIAAVKAMQERRLQESAEKAKARRLARHQARALAEIRDLPSLNFSRMDLIDKLNQALEVRPSKSLEVVRRREHAVIHCPSPQRPQSTEPLRERYMSFFSKPEDFSSWLNECMDDSLESSQVSLVPSVPVPKVEVQDPTEADESVVEAGPRALSPQDFLSVASQINRLSIPSVSGLSDRLTELLPCLRNLQLDSILATDEDVQHTIDDIKHLGLRASRPETVLSTRTSAGFRTLAERAEEIVQRGTHDSIVPTTKAIETDKALPSLPESVSAGRISAIHSTDGKQSYLSGSVSAPSDLGKDLTRPSSALVRVKSPTTEEEVRALLPPESNPIARGAKRHLMSSGASTRPWNQDENYPWSGPNISIDLNVPSEAHLRDSIATDTLRRTRSMEIIGSKNPAETNRGIDIGSIRTNLGSSASITTEQATGVSSSHTRKQSTKRSIIGSISKRIGLSHGRQPGASESHDGRSPSAASPRVRSDESLPHKPGDRYPTTALTPPAGYIIDEVRSFFSDDSSEKRRTASFRKRLTVPFKGKGKTVRVESGPRGHSPVERIQTGYDAGQINAERQGPVSSAQTYDGIVMGKAEFHFKRLGIKLRNLIARGGNLIRSFSTRSHKLRDDWLSDSIYSNA